MEDGIPDLLNNARYQALLALHERQWAEAHRQQLDARGARSLARYQQMELDELEDELRAWLQD